MVKILLLYILYPISRCLHLQKQIAAAQTTVLPFVIAGVFYYIFNFVVAWVMEWFEKKMNYYH